MEITNRPQQGQWDENNDNTPVNEPNRAPQKYYTEDREDDDLEDDDDRHDNDRDEADDDDDKGDWGSVDPLEHPGPPSDMDPSAPGSAV